MGIDVFCLVMVYVGWVVVLKLWEISLRGRSVVLTYLRGMV